MMLCFMTQEDKNMRIEQDCVGPLAVPDEAKYGIHSVRASQNFPISPEKTNLAIIYNLVAIKQAAAKTNMDAGTLAGIKAQAIIKAGNEVLAGKYDDQFIVPAIQGGAGTSTNMNVNEVLANVAQQYAHAYIHPNDDVNQSQSTNDTYPTAGKMAMLQSLPRLFKALDKMQNTLILKTDAFSGDVKVGRTQLQDAVPTTFGSSFYAYYSMFKRDIKRIKTAAQAIRFVNLGGTAIGTGLNTSSYYGQHIVEELNHIAGYKLKSADDLIDATQNCDNFVEFSSALKALAVSLIKFANDLRLLSSGPQAGLGELKLPAKQAGSSIMPGKVNPVIPEVVNQVAFEVIGHDTTVMMAAQAGQLELNAFEPIILRDLLDSESMLTSAITTLNKNCLQDIEVDRERSREQVENSAISATVLSPTLGYERSMKLIKQAIKEHCSVKQLLIEQHILPLATIKELFSTARLLNRENSDMQEHVASK